MPRCAISNVPDSSQGFFVFPTLADLSTGNADFFSQSFGNFDTNFSELRLAAYAQDHWNPARTLTIDYGLPIHVPMVDVKSVGAGGGSIASINAAGMLQVGPHSAGSDPGPICYGRGGAEPTVTDANLVLGRLDPERLLAVSRPVTVAVWNSNSREPAWRHSRAHSSR